MTDESPSYWRWHRFNHHQWVSYPGAHIVIATSRYSCNNAVEYPQHISQNARGSRARISCRESESQLRHTPDTQVVLPLSPNHRLFANDGLCSESKISVETLSARWSPSSFTYTKHLYRCSNHIYICTLMLAGKTERAIGIDAMRVETPELDNED